MSLLFGLFFGTVLVLSGVGLGTVSAAVIGMTKMAELQKPPLTPHADGAEPSAGRSAGAFAGGGPASAPEPSLTAAVPVPAGAARSTLGVEAVDAPEGGGAMLVGVHVPGPGQAAGLVRGDVLTAFGGTRIDSAADLASAVAAAQPGKAVTLTVRRADGDRRELSATPGVVT
ncbi:PDZ domain-containing protein [Streptomyces jeddahensis]|uniref:PDZ domain-containing protein n=1 Tax=Streptomyces jeddahensis TaxID=1716141 RepID=UPI0038CD225F